jgi:multidrug efflux pump subunit AcrA (membrane-fusion protein)
VQPNDPIRPTGGRRSGRAGVLLLLVVAGCARSPAGPPAAAPEKPKVEGDLARTTISSAARKSLRVRSAPARKEPVQVRVSLTGWVMAPPGNEVTVTAPVAGYVHDPGRHGKSGKGSGLPVPGLPVRQGQELLTLEPVLSPVEQIQMAALRRGVEGELAKAKENVTVAEAELKRVRDLNKQGLRGQQEVEQAHARLTHAKEDLAAAEDKLKLFAESSPGEKETRLRPMTIRAPRAGTVLMVQASPGQYVSAAAPLVTIADLSRPWVRVPVPESDLAHVDREHPVTVVLKSTALGEGPGKPLRFDAKPVAIVPLVDPARHTADLVYELTPYPRSDVAREAAGVVGAAAGTPAVPPPARPALFAKDQMLTVEVPLGERREETVVPYSAVVFDAYAGTWIYIDHTKKGATECAYERRRVELGPAIGDDVVIRPGTKPGERVVVAGAAALFSREFHKPPVAAGSKPEVVDDDD